MKFTLSWLKTHLDTDAPLDTITDALTRIGLELEGVEDAGAPLAPFRIAHVVEAVQHPNADRLRVCTVDTGDGAPVTVVCGAPNARTGMKAVFAPPGSYIPGLDTTLKIGEIRGIQSAGMLLSYREMALGEDHTGIVDLPEDAPIGIPYPAYAGLDDPVIDISITPNRGDALAVRGVARDLAAAGIGTLRPWARPAIEGKFPSPITWRIDSPACPWVLGRTVRGVRNGPSPEWLQRRLRAIGLRPISALVDITNFFTIDLGRPLHVFDANKVRGGVLAFRSGAGETFRALNGRDYTTTADDCVIADAAGVQSLAGVMGGEATGSQLDTTDVFIECALFDPVAVALTGRRHDIISDARSRFERGIDVSLLPAALDAATAMVIELCGGEASEVAEAGAEPAWQRHATLRFERLETLGGLAVPAAEAVAALEALGFTVQSRDANQVTVAVPPWRNDVASAGSLDQAPALLPELALSAAAGRAEAEPEADLVEEVLRLRGLDAVPAVSMPAMAPVPLATYTPRQVRAATARRTLASRGMLECVTFSFVARDRAALFGDAPAALRLVNPIAADLDQMRPTPLATITPAAARNVARGLPVGALFEVGPAFSAESQEVLAAGLRHGPAPRSWDGAAQAASAMGTKADVFAVLAALGVPMDSLSVTAEAPAHYHPGRSGTVRQGPKLALAYFGELHPRVLAGLDLPGPAAAFEVRLDAIPEPKRRRKALPDLPTFQPLRRDFAFVVDAATPAETLLRAAKGAERTLITGVSLFDVYEGEGVPAGQKSLAIEVVIQPRDATMTDAAIEAVCAKIVAAVTKASGAVLRG
ncbi:phenylalanine--tRNA ligase subunit beta [Acidisphaera sp. L21]|uniref:phenylalanine--tRNA ligase subunit beta n=1 Tax=Acidisphaera sp. L21 TaxID=1641851 RepID=UPI00131E7A6A|nr:phenylalanine--tRNA ligase subunit beta [Acidisphaera sp. L21]